MPSQCLLQVGVIGLSYKTAPLSLREKVAKGAAHLRGQRSLFFPYPILLLSTCNRVELYFTGDDLAEVHEKLLSFLRGRIERDFEKRLYSFFGFDCFLHLAKVSSGLDSAIFGETEIQRQVKLAYESTRKILSLPKSFHYVFQKAFRIAKAIRSVSLLEKRVPSLYHTMWEIALEKWGDLKGKKILLLGHSEVNRAFARFLDAKGVGHYLFCTRHVQTGRFIPRDELVWQRYDFIIAASLVEEGYLIEGQSSLEHLIFDLSIPRNVDPKLSDIPSISLYNIEEIHEIAMQKRVLNQEAFEKTVHELEKHAARLAQKYREKTLAYSQKLIPLSKFHMAGESGERDHIANIFHSGDE